MTDMTVGTLKFFFKGDKPSLRAELAESEAEIKQSGERTGRSMADTVARWARETVHKWTQAGGQAGDGFWRNAYQALRSLKISFSSVADDVGKAVGEVASSGFRLFSTGAGGAITATVNLSTNLWALIPALLTVAAAMLLAAPAALLLGGALGSLPAIATGGLAAIAVLGLGSIGLADAFKQTASAGGAVVDRARQVALAERRVAEANREVLASQLSLNNARKIAAERLQDLNRNLRGAQNDEADAVAAVEEAQRGLNRALEGGNPQQIEAAERALKRAEQSLEDVRDRVQDLREEQAEASQKGVEGSDEVTAALDRQRKAVEGVEDANYDLQKAQQPTGGGAADEATKIAVSAMRAVATIKGLKAEFDDLRLGIQEKLFSGADVEIQTLWDAWLPTLKQRLGSMAFMFNGLFHTWAETSKKPEFISNIAAGWEHIQRLIDRVFTAVVGPGLEAFGRLSRAAGPFIDALGEGLGGIVDDFARWIEEAEKSGALKEFFKDAGSFLSDIFAIGTDVARILGSIIGILLRQSKEGREAGMDDLVKAFDDAANWFDDPKNQAKIDGWFNTVREFFVWIQTDAIPTVSHWVDKINEWSDRVEHWIDRATALKNGITNTIDDISDAVNGLPDRVSGATSNMWDGIKNSFKAAINWVIAAWNNLELKLPQTTFLGQTLGGGAISTPNIPLLAGGGLVKATPGGRAVGVAEAGEDEIVSPVDMMRRIVSEEFVRYQAEQRGGPKYADIHVHVGDEVTRVIRVELKEHDRKAKRDEHAGAGTR